MWSSRRIRRGFILPCVSRTWQRSMVLPFSWVMWMSEELEWKDIFAFLGYFLLA